MALIEENEVIELEKMVWDALVSGDRDADASLLADDFLGVYSTGFDAKAGHVTQLENGPTIRHYELSEITVRALCSGVVLVSYKAEFLRCGGDVAEVMYVSSIWQHRADKWLNIFSQDTPVAKLQL